MARKTMARVMAMLLMSILCLLPAVAFAASPKQDPNPDMVGLWVSEESTQGETVSLSFFDDGSMQGQSEFTDGSDTILYEGTWGDNGDDTVSVLIDMVDGEAIGDEPFEVVYDVVSDTELNAAETTDFGDDGMTITWEDAEPVAFVDEAGSAVASSDAVTDTEAMTDTEAVTDTEAMTETEVVTDVLQTGVYVSNGLEDSAPVAAFVYINEDGTYQSVAVLFDYATAPSTQTGSWTDNGDGTVTLTSAQELSVTVDGAEFVDLDEPQDLEFTIKGDVLEGEVLSLYRLSAVEDKMTGFAGMVEEDLNATDVSTDTTSTDMTSDDMADVLVFSSPMADVLADNFHELELWPDETASFTYGTSADDATIETGTWSQDDNGVITVELTQDAEGADLDAPSTLVFEPDADGNLVATDFDADIYGDSITLEPIEAQ